MSHISHLVTALCAFGVCVFPSNPREARPSHARFVEITRQQKKLFVCFTNLGRQESLRKVEKEMVTA